MSDERITLRLPVPLHRVLRMKAKSRASSESEIARKAVEAELMVSDQRPSRLELLLRHTNFIGSAKGLPPQHKCRLFRGLCSEFRVILMDTGPLVAMANAGDAQHETVLDELDRMHDDLVSTWVVIGKAAWSLRKRPSAVEEMLSAFVSDIFRLYRLYEESLPWISKFLRKYADLGAQLADASLMYVAEKEKIDTVFTLDRRDFSVYRTNKNRALKIVP